MSGYPFQEIEAKWQKIWEDTGLYHTDLTNDQKKLYCLVMFIYPSGDKLHIGHWYNYAPTDTWARFKRLQGYNIFEPIGYDAFGLPAENYAIKVGVPPAESTAKNITYIRQQLKNIGAMYDWSKEVNTSEPEYYRWTQWIFLTLYKNGLAYKSDAAANWCPDCQTVLANEQVVEGQCERCGTEVIRKFMKQWFFKITDYAERLLEGHNRIQWPEKTITMQKNWIGRSEGATVSFPIAGHAETLKIFTTRPDTLFGVTYMVMAPEHPLVSQLTTAEQKKAVQEYVVRTQKESEIERTSTEKEKTGVFTGAFAVNPLNGEKIPIWISDYVLLSYGTGAIMAVPGHDQRDFEFARKFNLPIREVILPPGKSEGAPLADAYTGVGTMINSGEFSGLASDQGVEKIISVLEQKKIGQKSINYKLRDWLISRQRYWGAPIPIIYCDRCGEVPVAEAELPVLLPKNVKFSGKGESPLTTAPDFVNTTCPTCGQPAHREVDTMDTFVCSSWYFLRYLTPHQDNAAFDRALSQKWLPVDMYVGGAEHAVMHLLYARFITKVLYDLNYINFDEPFTRLIHQGTITHSGAKMSKSKGNVVIPDDYIRNFGSDTFRMYMMFMGSYEIGGDWADEGIFGVHRFLNRVWRLVNWLLEEPPTGDEKTEIVKVIYQLNYAIKHVGIDIERFNFNTAISRIMELVNQIYLYRQNLALTMQNRSVLMTAGANLVQLLAPFAPHLAEEMWQLLGHKESVFQSIWPTFSEAALTQEKVTIVVQINGKVRSKVEAELDSSDEQVMQIVLADPRVQNYLEGKKLVRHVVVKNKLANLVIS